MPLSPFAQYHIRKLLRQDIETLTNLLVSESGSHRLSDSEIEKILNNIYLDSSQAGARIEELELLTNLYQELEANKSDESTLTEIKRRIFQVLNFQSSSNLPKDLLPVIQEKLAPSFNFYHNGKIRKGIHHQHEFFGEVRRFHAIHRLQAYQFAWALLEHQVPLIITASAQSFVIWVNIQSPTYSTLLSHDATFLRMLLSLHLVLRKGKHMLKKPLKKIEQKLWLQ